MKKYNFLILLIIFLSPFLFFIIKNKEKPKASFSKEKSEVTKSYKPPKVYSLPSKKEPAPERRTVYVGKIKNKKEIKPINTYNPNWQENLKINLLKFQNSSVDVKITLKESMFMVSKNKGRLVEKVIVNYFEKDEFISSFSAIVDSESGSILKTYDKMVIQERRKAYPKLRPYGTIKNPPARRIKDN